MEDQWYAAHDIHQELLYPEERWLLKFLDTAELCGFCQIELKRGNQDALACYNRACLWLQHMLNNPILENFQDHVRQRIDKLTDLLTGGEHVSEPEASGG